MMRTLVLLLTALAAGAPGTTAVASCEHRLEYYGTYSVGRNAGAGKVPLATRLRELRGMGVNMIVATGSGTDVLDVLPEGMLAVPGCGLLKRDDWTKDGRLNEAQARARLGKLAPRFAKHPRVYGVCVSHEVTEFANHDQRRRMYQLAKEYFPEKKVIQYYGRLWDKENPRKQKVFEYGKDGEIETDVLFVSLPAVRKARFDPSTDRLEAALDGAARTPGIPLWGQTSINADHKYVNGPGSMLSAWGEKGENMPRWVEKVLAASRTDAKGNPVRFTGFFWRSFGRFPYDLAYPDFAAHRAQVRTIGESCVGK
jgi:hypothetical protein